MSRFKTEDIVQNITDAIEGYRLPPGTRLIEQSVGDLYGVSRMTVRQALQKLAGDELVTLEYSRGACVASPTPSQARDIFEVREALEIRAVQLLVERASDQARAALQAHVDAEIEARQRRESDSVLLRMGTQFHVALGHHTGNALLSSMLRRNLIHVALIVMSYRHRLSSERDWLQRSHVAIMERLHARDRDGVVQLIQEHVRYVQDGIDLDEPLARRQDIRSALIA